MTQVLDQIRERIQAMTETSVTAFEVVIVDAVVRRFTEGLIETPLRRRLRWLPLEGRTKVAFGEWEYAAVNRNCQCR